MNTPKPGALAGVRVFELTTAWAGPFAGRHLAALGAEVIKVESPQRIDNWRSFIRTERLPGHVPGEKPWNRTAFFNTQNTGKRSIGLDLNTPGGRDVALRLVEVSDLVLANFSGGALARMGLGRVDLLARNPQISLVEMPAFRYDSHQGRYVGMGHTMEASSGMTTLMGQGDGRPVMSGPAYMDPVGGLHGAATALACLWQARRTGAGRYVELAQVDAAVRWIGEYLSLQETSGRQPRPEGNTLEGVGPHDAFPCQGQDEWVAIAATDQDEWAALAAAMGQPELAGDPRFAEPAMRWENREALYALIADWTSDRYKTEVAASLQAAGVRAAPVNTGRDLVEDGALTEIGFVADIEHPEAGRHQYPGLAPRLSHSPTQPHLPAPTFGEATDYVLRDVLGLDEGTVTELLDSGAVSRDPYVTRVNDS